MTNIGKPLNRIDGKLKVTGAATYSAEYSLEGLVHGVLVTSTIAKGNITNIDTQAAENAPGVLAVITHRNLPKLATKPTWKVGMEMIGQSFEVMQGTEIFYSGQPIALVVADTLERATHAARIVQVNYQTETPITFHKDFDKAEAVEKLILGTPGKTTRGNITEGLAKAEVKITNTYNIGFNHHNPLEPSATIAQWEGNKLTLYESTQGVSAFKNTIASLLGLPTDNVRIIAKYVGGGFGCKTMVWPHIWLTVLAARMVERPVKLVLSREQMYSSVGYREAQNITLTLGATRQGELTAISTVKTAPVSPFDNYTEPSSNCINTFYNCPNFEANYRLLPSNLMTGIWMRAPGEVPGMFVLETSMDELAYELGIDPLELRLRNYANTQPGSNKPWSSKSLKQCYTRGAELFEWAKRNPEPGSMREGGYLIGYGMASASYPVFSPPVQSARARLQANGHIIIQCSGTDIGTGMYTILAQVAADSLGVSTEEITVEIGDSSLPSVAISGGSMGAGSASNAVYTAANNLRRKLIELAVTNPQSPLSGVKADDVTVEKNGLALKQQSDRFVTYSALMSILQQSSIEVIGTWQPDQEFGQKYAMASFGAIFAKVLVDPNLGYVRATKFVGVYGAGRILNQKTARSQMLGGIVWGLSQVLLEQTHQDANYGRFTNANLAEYLIPVNADIPSDITVEFVPENDPYVNVLGVKGIGELGMVGVNAAIANAIYHATGKRLRDLPITPEKFL